MNPVTGDSRSRTVHVPVLARVEGEGEIDLRVRKGALTEVKLRIPEPPRLFEGFLRGRSHLELPDLTARICGICPVAYQMSSARAAERAFGITVSEPIRQLRRLMYCGEWLESHALHVVMLHAPDFLGYPSGLHMAKDHPRPVLDGLELKKIGNEVMTLIGGREIHPVSLRVGGFWRTPTTREVRSLAPKLERAGELALHLLRWVKDFRFPDLERDYVFVSLRDEEGYPLDAGRIVSNHGHSVDAMEWDRVFTEEHVRHSNALHAVIAGHGPYLTGPLARYALNSDRLSGPAADAAREVGLGAVERNPFRSILVRAVEMVWAADEAARIVATWQAPEEPFVEATPVEGVGAAATEAPRGLLWHRYVFDAAGLVKEARIVPPTAQNLRSIEEDLRAFAATRLELDDETLRSGCEQAVRNHDPCISCATHFLRVRVTRE
ncbi:MAG: Ni/Fe hydrogenase subunit alpha [Candidatus Eisenbacteria bacterium]